MRSLSRVRAVTGKHNILRGGIVPLALILPSDGKTVTATWRLTSLQRLPRVKQKLIHLKLLKEGAGKAVFDLQVNPRSDKERGLFFRLTKVDGLVKSHGFNYRWLSKKVHIQGVVFFQERGHTCSMPSF